MANVFGPKNLPSSSKGKPTKGKGTPEIDTAITTVKGKAPSPAAKYYNPSSKKK